MSDYFAFDNPFLLFFLIVLIPILLYDKFSSNIKSIYKNLPGNLKRKLAISKIFFRLFLFFSIIAMAGPRWGITQAKGEYRRSLDAVLAFDLSRSMETADAPGSITRLEYGIKIIKETVSLLPEIRYAAAAGSSRGIAAVPLTYSNNAVLDLLDTLTNLSISGRGTNLESLLDAASGSFLDSSDTARVIILVSDGENLSGDLMAALLRCGEKNITVIALLTGSKDGGLVPGIDDIHSIPDRDNMEKIAAMTGGIFIDTNAEDSSEILVSNLKSFSSETRLLGNKKELKSRWYLFVLLAIISFGVSKASLLQTSFLQTNLLKFGMRFK